MSLLSLDVSRCVRTSNKFAICNDCVTACPIDIILINEENNLPSFVPNDCVGCGGCLAACPDEAYSLDDFNALDYIFSFLESDKNIVSCKDDIPCIAALSTEEMLSLAILAPEKLRFNRSFCSECDIAKKNEAIIDERVDEVNFLLEAMEVKKEILFEVIESTQEKEKSPSSRRDFLSKLNVEEAVKVKQNFENEVEARDEFLKEHIATIEDIQSIRQKKIPNRRKLLGMAMKRVDEPSQFHRIESEDITFTSQKVLDENTCTNCQMCYRICPTGALQSDNHGSFIDFTASECIKCHSCHDVCEPDALTLSPVFDLKNLFKPEQQRLAKFDLRRCNECGMPFIYSGGEVICTRCRIEEEEANELWEMK